MSSEVRRLSSQAVNFKFGRRSSRPLVAQSVRIFLLPSAFSFANDVVHRRVLNLTSVPNVEGRTAQQMLLAELPGELIDYILQHGISYSVFELWKCGSSRLNAKIVEWPDETGYQHSSIQWNNLASCDLPAA